MNKETVKSNPKLQRLLKNIGIGSYNFEIKSEPGAKEILSQGKMKDLFGESYKNIVYFNYDTGVWNRPHYLGYSIGDQRVDTRDAMEMRRMIELEPQMQGYELVASVTMATDDENYPGTGRITHEPQYKRARNIIGTLILRDKKSGKILPVAPCWLGVESYPKMSIAAFYGADGLAYKLANVGQLRNMFVSKLVHQIQK